MGLFYKSRSGHSMDFTLELKPDWYNDINVETRGRFLAPEWFPQSGIQLIWPTEETDWNYMLSEIADCYIRIVYEIAKRERLLIVTSQKERVKKLLCEKLPAKLFENIYLFECPINDTWARDSGVITMITPNGPEILDFGFNGWGGKFKADKDNAINKGLKENNILNGCYRECKDFILEGGSIETDGKGVLLTTESCLLSSTRNGKLNKADIELTLKRLFNLQEILWLKHGRLEGDDTNGHIDTLARMCPNNTIAYVKCSDLRDSHYEELKFMEEELKSFVMGNGKPFNLIPLPMPDAIYDADNGERLPATYANYLALNEAVLVPSYKQPIKDRLAAEAIGNIYKGKEIVSVPSSALIRQHGSIHCSAMQFPAGVLRTNEIKAI